MSTYTQLLEKLDCAINHTVTDEDLHELKSLLNNVWKRLNIDIAFTSHFLDRVNDARNNKQITVCELAKLFMEAFKKFGPELQHITKPEWEAVLTDLQTNVNVPFVLKHNGREVTIVAKTVMRKKGFFTPDPKLQVAGYKPTEGNTMGNKTFRELKEWVGLNYPDNDTGRAIQAVDDVDTAAFSVETPDVLEKLNVLLSSLCQKQVINPYYIINDIWKKLSMVGLNFDMRAITFVGGQGRVTVPVTQYGGRYGALSTSTGPSSAPGSVGSNPASFVSSDDGTRLPGGLMLSITFMKTDGTYHMEANLERGMENLPFVEETSIKEAKQYTLSPAQSFSHVPANPERTAFNRTTNTYKEFPHSDAMHKHLSGPANHADTWKAWHDTPAGFRHKEAKKKVAEAQISEAVFTVRHMTVKNAMGVSKEGWYVLEDGKPGARYDDQGAAEKHANAMKSVRYASKTFEAMDPQAAGFRHKEAKKKVAEGRFDDHSEDRFKNGEDVKLGKRDAHAIRAAQYSKHAWQATDQAKRTNNREDHSIAWKAHQGAFMEHEPGTPAWKAHAEQSLFHKKAAYGNKIDEALLPKPKEPNTLHMSDEQKTEAMHNHAQHKIAYWKAIMKHRASKKEDTAHALKMLRRAQDSLAIWQMHKDGKKSLGEANLKKK